MITMKNEKNQIETVPKSNNTLLDYIRYELRRGYALQNDEQRYNEKRDKFYVFLQVPLQLEKFIFYGFFQCMDAFLFVLTFLPFRCILAVLVLLYRIVNKICSSLSRRTGTMPLLNPAETCDLLKGIILIFSLYVLGHLDFSMVYHLIKSQSVIKLYIFFNMLEVADKLLSSFGQDILDTLFWTATEPNGTLNLKLLFHIAMAGSYVALHTFLVLLQATTLNVAINSKNKALLTVMMSNNFVELKSMVFKKFEKNNLFHMSCSDVRERFHYLILLFVVIIQTMKEYNWSDAQLRVLLPDCMWVLLVEVAVDWFKHAFVTRFNEIGSQVYKDYSLSLAYDLVGSKLKNAFSDHSDIISRRMGFIPLTLSVLFLRTVTDSFAFADLYSYLCLLATFLCLVVLKLSINIALLGKSCVDIDEHRRQLEEKVNKVIGGQSASLPASRHNSATDLSILKEEDKLQDIRDKLQLSERPSTPVKVVTASGTKSTPHSPSSSPRHVSLEDITKQVAMLQTSLDDNVILSDSTVSLISLNYGHDVNLPQPSFTDENVPNPCKASTAKKRLSLNLNDSNLRRRKSLQDVINLQSFQDSANVDCDKTDKDKLS